MLNEQLKIIRKANKYTQEDLSKALGIERSTYASYETGRNKPDVILLKKIADVFGVNVDFILEIDTDKKLSVNDVKSVYKKTDADLISRLSKEEKAILGRYRTLSDTQKDSVIKALDIEL